MKNNRGTLKNLGHLMWGDLEGFIRFLIGTLVGSVILAWLGNLIGLSEFALILATLVLIIAVIYHVAKTLQHTQELADSMGILVRYEQELYREDGTYEGMIFKKLVALLENARNEVLVLGSSSYDSQLRALGYRQEQAKYFQALVEIVRRRQREGFKYIRIYQVSSSDGNLEDAVSEESARHCIDIIDLASQNRIGMPEIDVQIMKVTNRRVSAFMIIDRTYVILQVDALTEAGIRYPVGLYFLEDRKGALVRDYCTQFERLIRNAIPIERDELTAVLAFHSNTLASPTVTTP